MRTTIAAGTVTALLGLACATPSAAQQETQGTYIYGTYFSCGASYRDADEAVEKWAKPVYDAAVADGSITSWGWLGHRAGGSWLRVLYSSATTLQDALASSDQLFETLMSKEKKSNAKWEQQFNEACESHEDYIWSRVAGNDGAGRRGDVGFSVYYVCDSTREQQADALVKSTIAPVYDKLIADGQLVSWGWWEHIVGGKYRRLETFTAKDVKSLVDARMALMDALQDEPLAEAVSGICDSHQDYIWDIKIQNP